MDILILPFKEANVKVLQVPPEVVKVIPTEGIPERIVAQAGDQTVLQVAAKILDVIKAIPTERSSERIVEQES